MSAFLKNVSVKVLGGRCFQCQSEAPSPPMTISPPLHNVYSTLYIILIHSGKGGGGGGELTREKVRGALLHKAGREYQHD
jgi:hypothetical protein